MKGLNHFLWLINKGKVFVLRVRKANARKTQTLWSKSRPVKTSACFFHSAGASSRRRLAQEQQWRLTRILPFIFNIFIHMTKHFLQKYKTWNKFSGWSQIGNDEHVRVQKDKGDNSSSILLSSSRVSENNSRLFLCKSFCHTATLLQVGDSDVCPT